MAKKPLANKKAVAKKAAKKKPFLKIAYSIKDTTLFVKVLEQTESNFEFDDEGFMLCSEDYPEIAEDGLFVRGLDKSKDNTVVKKDFHSVRALNRYISDMVMAIDAYNTGSEEGLEWVECF